MQLERSRAVLRTRRAYEAADLGVLLLRRLYRPTLWAWLWIVVPVQLAVLWACSSFHVFFGYLALWWLKPLYDRPLGLVLGRGLFGEVPKGRKFLSALWAQGRRKLLADLSYRRFDPARSLVAPVTLLEGVRGAVATRRRHALVMANSASVATVLLACMATEVGCTVGIGIGVLMLMPEELPFILADLYSTAWDDLTARVFLYAYALAIGLCEPLYVASGFGLYIDRRTTLEGWDVELAFRRMARRLAPAATAVLLLSLAVLAAPTRAQSTDAAVEGAADAGAHAVSEDEELYSRGAATDEQRRVLPKPSEDGQAAGAMDKVLARPELRREHVEEHWELRERPDTAEPTAWPAWLGALASSVAESAAILVWGLAAVALAVLLYMLVETARRSAQLTVQIRAAEPEVQIRFERLPGRVLPPHEVVPRARALLAAGEVTGALSVLYVGTLAALVVFDALEVPAEATEGECLRRVGAAPIAPARRELFVELTTHWQLSAYAHVPPDPDQMDMLCLRFGACFGVPA